MRFAAAPVDLRGGSAPVWTGQYHFGATLLPDGTTRFRVWAPRVKSLVLELPDQTLPMKAQDAGFHEVVCVAPAGTRYRYILPDGCRLPDPASRMQDGDVHDASVVYDTARYKWQHAQWKGRPWTETVLYEVHCGVAGGFNGLRARLPQLAQLGVTAIELMPVADFPGPRNWGYDGVLPYAPDRAYGLPDDLKSLVDAAHGWGLMVFLDVVYNHFGPDGNYLHNYAPEFFRDDLSTPWGSAIDFRHPQVRRFFAENALYWVREYGFDGLRLDAVHAISDRSWLPEMAAFVRGALDPQRHVHLVLENDDNAASLLQQGFAAQWNDDGHHVLHHILTGESTGYYASYRDQPAALLARVLSEGFVYQGQPDPSRGAIRGEPTIGLSPDYFVLFLQNHDQIGNRAFGERLTQLEVPDTALRAAVALQLLVPQIPLIFMGEELGSKAPFLYFTSHSKPDLARAVRDGRRKEFASFSAFTEEGSRNSIPDPNAPETWSRSNVNFDATLEAATQWRRWYSHLLDLRRDQLVPGLAGTRSLDAQVLGPLAVRAAWQLGNGKRLTLFCNLDEQGVVCAELSQLLVQDIIFQGPGLEGDDIDALRSKGCLPGHCVIALLETPSEGQHELVA